MTKATSTPIRTPADFDNLVRGVRPEALWGLPAIGAALGVSGETVRRWLNDPECGMPIRRCGGRWFGQRSELEAWRAGR